MNGLRLGLINCYYAVVFIVSTLWSVLCLHRSLPIDKSAVARLSNGVGHNGWRVRLRCARLHIVCPLAGVIKCK